MSGRIFTGLSGCAIHRGLQFACRPTPASPTTAPHTLHHGVAALWLAHGFDSLTV